MHQTSIKDGAPRATTAIEQIAREPIKLAHTIPQAVQASGLSRSMLYLAIGRGELLARKCGARTVILDDDLRRFLSRLPRFASTTAMLEAAP
jgi:hypothetical protein